MLTAELQKHNLFSADFCVKTISGKDGKPGINGEDGVSPTVQVSKSGTTTTVSITDKDGEHIATIEDGRDGRDGKNGPPGADGVSPTITTSKSGKTTTITIVDKNGEHIATVVDGNDGQAGEDGRTPVVTATKVGKTTYIKVDDEVVATVNDGADGTNGTNGTNGTDGVSPIVTTSKSDKTTTITIADKDGIKIATVMDGNDGQNGAPGIYHGENEPTDPSHPIWVFSTDDEDGNNFGEQWELINVIEPTVEANALHITQDFNGQPFTLKKAFLFGYYSKYMGEQSLPSNVFVSMNNTIFGASHSLIYSMLGKPSKTLESSFAYLVETRLCGHPHHECCIRTRSGSNPMWFASDNVDRYDMYCRDAYGLAPNGLTELGIGSGLVYEGCYFALYGVRA